MPKTDKPMRLVPITNGIPNRYLTLDLIDKGLSRQEILPILLRQPQNVDCIVDPQSHQEMISFYQQEIEGWVAPSDYDRVEYILDQARRSSTDGSQWKALISDGKITSHVEYRKLRRQRLNEQIGREMNQEVRRRQKYPIISSDESIVSATKLESSIIPRIKTGFEFWDNLFTDGHRVGMCEGQDIIMGGERGAGKTRLLLHLAAVAANQNNHNHKVLFVASEWKDPSRLMSSFGANIRTELDDTDNLQISSASDVGMIIRHMQHFEPKLVIIDSKDTVNGLENVTMWKVNHAKVRRIARSIGCAVIYVAHLTQQKNIKGGTRVEHDPEAVMKLYLSSEQSKERFRVCVSKNRHGVADENRYAEFWHTGQGVMPISPPYDLSRNTCDDDLTEMMVAEYADYSGDDAEIKALDRIIRKSRANGFSALTDDERSYLFSQSQSRMTAAHHRLLIDQS